MKAFDLAKHQRLVYVEGERVRGVFHVLLPLNGTGKAWVKPLDVVAYYDDRRLSGRVLYSPDLTGSVQDGKATIKKHSLSLDKADDVLDVWDEMHAAMVAAVDVALDATQ